MDFGFGVSFERHAALLAGQHLNYPQLGWTSFAKQSLLECHLDVMRGMLCG